MQFDQRPVIIIYITKRLYQNQCKSYALAFVWMDGQLHHDFSELVKGTICWLQVSWHWSEAYSFVYRYLQWYQEMNGFQDNTLE